MNEKIFPTILIIIDIMASIPYFWQGDFRRGIYWCAAAILTLTVTW
jgi:hypothetical protein